MSAIEVFEPAMCCSTGVCGPDVPQELVTFSADFDWVRAQGSAIARFNLASEPTAFAGNGTVLQFLRLSGSEALPLVLVDGAVAMAGRYPTRDELARWAELAPVPAGRTQLSMAQLSMAQLSMAQLSMAQTSGSCCGGTGCC